MMKYLLWSALGLPVISQADTPFAGTWVVEPELTTYALRPFNVTLEKGEYKILSCSGMPEVPADGVDHPIQGDPYFDSMSVRSVNRSRVEVAKKTSGKVTWKGLYSVSADRKSMTLEFEDDRATKPVTGKILFARQGDAVPGAHAVSGLWTPQKLNGLSASGLTVTYQDTDNGLAMTAGDGRGFDIKFDKKFQYRPLNGYLEGATVMVGRRDPKTLQIMRKQNGDLVEVSIVAVSDDSQTMTVIQVDQLCQAKTTWTLRKQPAS